MIKNIKNTFALAFFITGFLLTLSLLTLSPSALAHCQIPCGIYDDHARIKLMLEDAATIEKSLQLIAALSGKNDAQSQHQLVRWINNKEQHAQNIIATISDYFLTQRVKPKQKDYIERLQKHHGVIVAAMQAKQQTESSYGIQLTKSIKAIAPYYPEHKH